MASVNSDTNPLSNFTEDQLERLEESINTLDEYEEKLQKEEIYELNRIKLANRPFSRLIKSTLEIINRILFFIFLGSFFFSFVFIYLSNQLWFFIYLISTFSCILYTPNRKAIKELIAAWPNIEDLIKKRSLWKK